MDMSREGNMKGDAMEVFARGMEWLAQLGWDRAVLMLKMLSTQASHCFHHFPDNPVRASQKVDKSSSLPVLTEQLPGPRYRPKMLYLHYPI